MRQGKGALAEVEMAPCLTLMAAFPPDAPRPFQALIDPDYLKSRAALISRERAQEYGPGAPKAGGTFYLTVADASGMMVSFIQSNYSGFGSGVVVPGTGISLQNRGAASRSPPASPMRWPQASACPPPFEFALHSGRV